jgi:hypothetical protein
VATKPRRCKFHTTHANKQCREPAVADGYCERHNKSKFLSKDPILRARQQANLKYGAGVPSGPHLKKTFAIEPTALAEKIEDIKPQVLIRDDDGEVPANLRRKVVRAAKYELELEWLEKKPSLTARDDRRREWLENKLEKVLDDLGMNSKSRLEYQPYAEAQERAKRVRSMPSRDPVQVKQRIGVLMRSGAFNQQMMELAASLDPHGTGRDVLLNPEELVALGLAEEEPEEETTDTSPRLADVVQIRKDNDASDAHETT